MRSSTVGLLVPLLAVFVVVVAGGSLRRKGAWSSGTYYGVLAVAVAIVLVAVVWRLTRRVA